LGDNLLVWAGATRGLDQNPGLPQTVHGRLQRRARLHINAETSGESTRKGAGTKCRKARLSVAKCERGVSGWGAKNLSAAIPNQSWEARKLEGYHL